MKRTLNILSPIQTATLRPVPGRDLIVGKPEASPTLSPVAHVILILVFVVLMIVYTVLTLHWHFTRPDEENFLQLPSGELPAVNLVITTRCSNPPNCGDVTISANYSDSSVVQYGAPLNFNDGGGAATSSLVCEGLKIVTILKNETSNSASVTVPLCYVFDTVINPQIKTALPVPGIQINFAGINPGVNKSTTPASKADSLRAQAEVTIAAEDGSFSRLVNMDTWQVKTLLVEQSVAKKDGVIQSTSANPSAIQYEGGRSNWRSTLFIQQAAFANTYATKRPGNILTVIAGIGGAFYVVLALISILAVVLGVCCPGPMAIKKRELQKERDDAKNKEKDESSVKQTEK